MGTIATLTILSGAPESDVFLAPNDVDYSSTHVKTPVAWTAADLKLQYSDDLGTTWRDVVKDTNVVSIITNIPTAVGALVNEPLDANSGLGYWSQAMKAMPNAQFRVVSINTAGGADLNQGANRLIDLVTAK